MVVMLCVPPPPPPGTLEATPAGHWFPGVLPPGGAGGRADVAWNVAMAIILCLWLHSFVRSSFPFCSGADHCLDATYIDTEKLFFKYNVLSGQRKNLCL